MENTFNEEMNILTKRRFEELEEIKKMGINPFAYSFDVDNKSKIGRASCRERV